MAAPERRLATLDGLRILAALAVAAYHFLFRGAAADGYLAIAFPEAAPAARFGYLGVHLFFLISGFVIAWSAEGRSAARFAVARFVRLWPGYVIGMTITFAVTALAGHAAFAPTLAQWAANLTMVAPAFGQPFMDGVYWSIVLELVFYFWVAVAVAAGLFERRRLELVAAWLLLAAANEFAIGSSALRFAFVTEYAGFFAGGVLAFDLTRRGRRPEALVLAVAAALFATASLLRVQGWMLDHLGSALTITELVASAIAIHLVFHAALALRLPASPVLATLGLATYPFYLLHQHIGYVAIDRLAPVIGGWPAVFAVVALLAILAVAVAKGIEAPAQRLLRAPAQALAAALDRRLAGQAERLA